MAEDNAVLDSLGGAAVAPAPAEVDTLAAIPDPSNHYSPGVTSSVEEKAVALLGAGIQSESVASALGVTPARISQLMAQKHFADKVSALRYTNLQSHNKRDSEYDNLEDKLLVKLKRSLPLMLKPRDILDALTRVNAAKRRGQTSPDISSSTQNVVNIILPAVVAAKFVTNMDNQVTKAGEQELLTMGSGNLLKQVEEAQAVQAKAVQEIEEIEYVQEKRN